MSDTYFIRNNGKRYKDKEISCKYCSNIFICPISQDRLYCSRNCFHKSIRNRVAVKCDYCGNISSRSLSKLNRSKSGYRFCNRDCKNKAQKEGKIKEILPPHYQQDLTTYRQKFSQEELKCKRCGYNEFPCSVDIHHIDEDRTNNKKENLEPLCANCHKALDCGYWVRNSLFSLKVE